MNAQPGLSICPLNLGTLVSIDKSVFTRLSNQGTTLDAPCLAWVVTGGEKKALVDTGPCDEQWAAKHHRPIKKMPGQEIVPALSSLGLTPDDIDLVIFTHLHWDHSFNLDCFANVPFFVQRRELEYAVAPLPSDRVPYEARIPGIQPPWMRFFGNIIALDGDQEIMPGVRVLHLPGHTPGSQGVVVSTDDGLWVIAGDTVPLYDNWSEEGRKGRMPGGVYQNLHDYHASLEKLEPFDGRILPGHDEKVLEHSEYPLASK